MPFNTLRTVYIDKIYELFYDDKSKYFSIESLRVCFLQMAFYIPSHDMIVSIMVNIIFDNSGQVRP